VLTFCNIGIKYKLYCLKCRSVERSGAERRVEERVRGSLCMSHTRQGQRYERQSSPNVTSGAGREGHELFADIGTENTALQECSKDRGSFELRNIFTEKDTWQYGSHVATCSS